MRPRAILSKGPGTEAMVHQAVAMIATMMTNTFLAATLMKMALTIRTKTTQLRSMKLMLRKYLAIMLFQMDRFNSLVIKNGLINS